MGTREIEEKLEWIAEHWERTQRQLAEYFVGNWDVVKMIYIGLLSGGHVLLEERPALQRLR